MRSSTVSRRRSCGGPLIEAFLDTGVETLMRAALASGSSIGEVALGGPDGSRLALRARRSPSGGVWLVLEDVSELRRLQQIRTEFIDNLSHELRTPLTTVSLLAETLTREAEAAGDAVPARMRDRIAKIELETGHLVQMVSELLDLSRIESGGALGAVDIIDLGRVASESTERLRLFADRQGVVLRTEIADPIAPVRGDPDRLGQVMVNLVHNAVKFSPDGGDVTVSVRPVAGDVVVAVADHGVGRAGTRPGAHLRALLQGRPGARPRRDRRDRARPGHRPPHHRAAWRPHLGRIHRGHRQYVLLLTARRHDTRPEPNDQGARWTACTSPRSTSATWPIAGSSACRCCWPTWRPCSPTSSGSRRSST